MQFFSFLLVFSISLGSRSVPFWQGGPRSASAAPAPAEKLSLAGIRNAGRVSDELFRGAQPHLSDLGELQRLGITTIVDLRNESPLTREAEHARAESLGLEFVSIPVGGFSNPTSAQLAQFFTLFRGSPRRRVFVHCEFGEDRTGVFVAAYRLAFDHWSAEEALSEMRAFGFNALWHPSMTTFVRALPDRLASDPTLKSGLSH
jgi:protein tyrosine/serine phosphatase